MQTIDRVVEALADVRVHHVGRETRLHAQVGAALAAAGIAFEHEVPIGPRDRVDFLCAGGVAVEIKRGKPNVRRVEAQVARYCASDRVAALVLVTERGLWRPVAEAHGKPVRLVTLVENWGVAL